MALSTSVAWSINGLSPTVSGVTCRKDRTMHTHSHTTLGWTFYRLFCSSLIALLLMSGCSEFSPAPIEFEQADIIEVGGLHTLEVQGRIVASLPATAPSIDAKQAELGRLLFWDPLLSGDQDVACGTCHLPSLAYTDAQSQAIGVGGVGRGSERVAGHTGVVRRNTQTLINTVWNGIDELGVFDPARAPMFWDNRATGFAAQAVEPIESREEMRGDSFTEAQIHAEIESRLAGNSEYTMLFNDAFGDASSSGDTADTITIARVATALAAFQSTLIANNSRFDQWMRGDTSAMTQRELSGLQEFVIAGCADCHSGPMFSDFDTHVLGVREGGQLTEPDTCDGSFAFRTPTLRQLEFTAPYFHAGQFPTLSRAIDFYNEPRRSENPNVPTSALDAELLDVPEMEDGRGALITDFLMTLSDPTFDQQIPTEVPSGLAPGGFLRASRCVAKPLARKTINGYARVLPAIRTICASRPFVMGLCPVNWTVVDFRCKFYLYRYWCLTPATHDCGDHPSDYRVFTDVCCDEGNAPVIAGQWQDLDLHHFIGSYR
jgi:cytochrome c peroxidase